MLLPSEWAAIWYKCLICHRCFQFPDKLIAHRKNTSCGIKYRDLHLDDSTSTSSTSEDEQQRQESSSKINDKNIPSTTTPHTSYEKEPLNTIAIPQTQNFKVDDTIQLSQKVSNCNLQGQLINPQSDGRPNQSIQNSCAVAEEEDEEENAFLPSNINTPSIPFSKSSVPTSGGHFSCKFCYKKLKSLKNLQFHIRNHRKNEKVYKCYFCSVILSQSQNLTRHLRIHTKEKPFKCTFCNYEFSYQKTLKVHQKACCRRINLSGAGKKLKYISKGLTKVKEFPKNLNKRFSCKICGCNFKFHKSLTLHINVHSKTNPYKCQNCGKMARDNYDLKKHMNTNSCREKAKGRLGSVTTHNINTTAVKRKLIKGPNIWIKKKGITSRMSKVANTGVKKWECFCKEGWKRQLECLIVHAKAWRGVRHIPHLKCTKCGFIFIRLHNLKRHLVNESCL